MILNLTYLLEFVCDKIPSTFEPQGVNLTRLSEMVGLFFSITTVGPESEHFNNILKQNLPGKKIDFYSYF